MTICAAIWMKINQKGNLQQGNKELNNLKVLRISHLFDTTTNCDDHHHFIQNTLFSPVMNRTFAHNQKPESSLVEPRLHLT
jgi:hypothetical protein